MRAEHWLYTVPLRLRSLFSRRRVERELNEELQFHLDQQIATNVARGMSPAEARTAALVRFGGVERRKDEVRDTRRVQLVENMWRDVRHALRTLRRSPGYTVIALLTLALGLGANTAIFTVVNAVLFRPLAYQDPDRLVVIQYASGETVAPGVFLDWKAASRSFDQMGVTEYWTPSLTGGDRAEELVAIRIGTDILPMLGVRPLLGRVFLPEEEHAGHHRVTVLRHDLWKTRFAGDSTVVGRTVTLNGEPYTVIGVMPPGFELAAFFARGAQLYAPLVLDDQRNDRSGSSMRAFAHLAPGITLEQARAELTTIAARLERDYPGTNQNVTAIPLQDKETGSVHDALMILLVAVGCVLLIACANVAHLQLMRATARGREFGMRSALGGSRARLLQQSLVESLVLSLGGGLLGLALATVGVRVLVALAPPGLPRLAEVRPDGIVFAFLAVISVIAAVASGVAPALAAARVDVHASLKDGGRSGNEGPKRRRLRSALVVTEFAMALILLVGAGLLLRSFAALTHVDAGFEPARTLSLKVSLAGTAEELPARRHAFFGALIERSRGLPGVVAASAINHVPLAGDDWHFPFAIEGRPRARPGEAPKAQFLVVRPDYFRTMGITLRTGREFTAADEAAASHLVIVNDFMARHAWPGESALGKRITVDDPAARPDWFTVVGVARDVQQGSLAAAAESQMYFPSFIGVSPTGNGHSLLPFLNPRSMTVVVRSAGDPAALVPSMRTMVASMEKDAPVTQLMTMDQAVSQWYTTPRFYLLLLATFAGVAVLLAAVGVYGVLSYSAARRTHEMGVRIALGAGPAEPFRLVAGEGMRLALVGGIVGLLAALGLTRYLRSLLYGVTPTDPLMFASAAAVLAVVALTACWFPARRASRVDPMTALRCD